MMGLRTFHVSLLALACLAHAAVLKSTVGEYDFSTGKLSRGLPGILRLAGMQYLTVQDGLIKNLRGVTEEELPVAVSVLEAKRTDVFRALRKLDIKLSLAQNAFAEALRGRSAEEGVSFGWLEEHALKTDAMAGELGVLSALGAPETLKILVAEHMEVWMRRVLLRGDRLEHDLYTTSPDAANVIAAFVIGHEALALADYYEALGEHYLDGRVKGTDRYIFGGLNHLMNLVRYTRASLLNDLDDVKQFSAAADKLVN